MALLLTRIQRVMDSKRYRGGFDTLEICPSFPPERGRQEDMELALD
jgi:hypothetical protein